MLLRLKVKPGAMKELKDFLVPCLSGWDAAHAREHEPHTVRFDVLPGHEPDTLFLYEAYSDESAFEFHQSQEPFQEFVSAVQERCVAGMDVLVGGVPPEASNALEQ